MSHSQSVPTTRQVPADLLNDLLTELQGAFADLHDDVARLGTKVAAAEDDPAAAKEQQADLAAALNDLGCGAGAARCQQRRLEGALAEQAATIDRTLNPGDVRNGLLLDLDQAAARVQDLGPIADDLERAHDEADGELARLTARLDGLQAALTAARTEHGRTVRDLQALGAIIGKLEALASPAEEERDPGRNGAHQDDDRPAAPGQPAHAAQAVPSDTITAPTDTPPSPTPNVDTAGKAPGFAQDASGGSPLASGPLLYRKARKGRSVRYLPVGEDLPDGFTAADDRVYRKDGKRYQAVGAVEDLDRATERHDHDDQDGAVTPPEHPTPTPSRDGTHTPAAAAQEIVALIEGSDDPVQVVADVVGYLRLRGHTVLLSVLADAALLALEPAAR